jgi:hypothetical protein
MLIIPGPIATDMRGSIGGLTASRNRGGAYFRARVAPVQPGSAEQAIVKQLLSQLVNVWSSLLTAEQRAAWDNYADLVHLPNSLGIMRNVGGLGMYVRGNLPRLQAHSTNYPRVDEGPVDFTTGEFTAPDVSAFSEATQGFQVVFDNTDGWASENASGMFVYVSRAQNPGINFFKGPYRFAGAIQGDDVTPPTSPAAMSSPFPFAETQKVFVRVTVSREDGRLSSTFRAASIAIA